MGKRIVIALGGKPYGALPLSPLRYLSLLRCYHG